MSRYGNYNTRGIKSICRSRKTMEFSEWRYKYIDFSWLFKYIYLEFKGRVTALYILPLDNNQDFLRFTSMKCISQEPFFWSVIHMGHDHNPYMCTNSMLREDTHKKSVF